MKKMNEIGRFVEKLNMDSDEHLGCWLFEGCINSRTGYGYFNGVAAHRWSYEHFTDKVIPQGMDLGHKCNVRNCCNPVHLQPMTRKENMAQMVKDGRYGKRSAPRFVTEAEYKEIKDKASKGATMFQISKDLKRSPTHIKNLLSGKTTPVAVRPAAA
jgi:hypothetical protein